MPIYQGLEELRDIRSTIYFNKRELFQPHIQQELPKGFWQCSCQNHKLEITCKDCKVEMRLGRELRLILDSLTYDLTLEEKLLLYIRNKDQKREFSTGAKVFGE